MADMMNAAPAPAPEQAAPAGPAMPEMGQNAAPAPAGPGFSMPPVLDGPTPGQSLTDAPKSQPWERPPQFPDPEDAADYIWKMLTKPAITKSTLTMMHQGMSVEALTKTMLFTGFTEGKWTMDTVLLLFKPVALMLYTLGKKADVKGLKLTMEPIDKLAPVRGAFNQTASKSYMDDTPEEEPTPEGTDVLAETKKVKPLATRKGKK